MEVLFDDYRIEYFIFVTRIHKNARPKTRSHKSINKITENRKSESSCNDDRVKVAI